MKQLRLMMGMPIAVEIVDEEATEKTISLVFEYFKSIDKRFSVYKDDSEVSRINRGEIEENRYSSDMKTILGLCEKTKKETRGYFEIKRKDGKIDPSGLVKGWAINNAANLLHDLGFKNYYVDAGGDIQVSGHNGDNRPWVIGIRNPFNRKENIKIISVPGLGVATSGTYIRGQHVYDPFSPTKPIEEVVSITVIGPNIYEADRMATAALAMREEGINFIQQLPEFEGYAIDNMGIATMTNGFNKYVVNN